MIPLSWKIGGIGFLVLGGLLAASRVESHVLRKQRDEARSERDAMAIRNAARELKLQGWTVGFAEAVNSVGAELRKVSAEYADVADQLEDANATIRQYASVVAEGSGEVDSPAEEQDEESAVPEWWSGMWDDGLLSGRWRFARVPAPNLFFPYRVTVPLDFITTEGGDGSMLVQGRSSNPNVTLRFEDLVFHPPQPERIEVTSFWRDALHVGLGAVPGVVAGFTFCKAG